MQIHPAVGGPRMGPLHLPLSGGFIVALLVLLAPPLKPSETVEPCGLLALQSRHGNRSLDNPLAMMAAEACPGVARTTWLLLLVKKANDADADADADEDADEVSGI